MYKRQVSDQSLAELHEFASRLGVSVRAFDQDHYDIPAHRHADALALGAVAVEGKDLARILIRSGLRVPARRRPAKLAPALTAAGSGTFRGIPTWARTCWSAGSNRTVPTCLLYTSRCV